MSSKRKQRRKGCIGKVAHKTQEHAAAALRGHFRTFGYSQGVQWYKCTHCGLYHIGHLKHAVVRSMQNYTTRYGN